ncbi:hypothetical protein GDO81_021058 [Engystomops pustulosus]|uniref:Uncharacterized protein n=1 Tax=Engystomops pustulosus TaxID=76066 RepID=A0AAV6YU48_ENGPU|nr:hypothetical protein GDO81_021058 [Engystomops pustulosus]
MRRTYCFCLPGCIYSPYVFSVPEGLQSFQRQTPVPPGEGGLPRPLLLSHRQTPDRGKKAGSPECAPVLRP